MRLGSSLKSYTCVDARVVLRVRIRVRIAAKMRMRMGGGEEDL